MGKFYVPPKIRNTIYGKVKISNKSSVDFQYLIGNNINSIIEYKNSTSDMYDKDLIILPQKYYIFVGNKDGEIQYKPYEYDEYRIVVSTYNNFISNIDSIG